MTRRSSPWPDQASQVRTTTLPIARAELRDRGYLREVSLDGRLPLLYEYEYVDPAPARADGRLPDPARRGEQAWANDGRRAPVLYGRTRRRGPARIRGQGAPRPCPKAGPGATSSERSATARMLIRSPPAATRSVHFRGRACRLIRSRRRSSGHSIRNTQPTCGNTRPAQRACDNALRQERCYEPLLRRHLFLGALAAFFFRLRRQSRVRADDLSAPHGGNGPIGSRIDGVLDEPNRAIEEAHVDAARVVGRGGEHVDVEVLDSACGVGRGGVLV